jgi:hypothetical protein
MHQTIDGTKGPAIAGTVSAMTHFTTQRSSVEILGGEK